MKPATVQVPVEEWELIEQLIDVSFDTVRLIWQGKGTRQQKLDMMVKHVKAVTKLAEYKEVTL